MHRVRLLKFPAASVLVFLLTSVLSWAWGSEQDPFEAPVEDAVRVIRRLLERGQTVTVGEFTEPLAYQTQAGVGIRRRLEIVLAAYNIKTSPLGGDLAVRGEAVLTPDGAVLNILIQDREGNPLRSTKLISSINDVTSVSRRAKPVAVLPPPSASPSDRPSSEGPTPSDDSAAPPDTSPGFAVSSQDPLLVAKLMGATVDFERIVKERRRAVTVQDVRSAFNSPTAVLRPTPRNVVRHAGDGSAQIYLQASDRSPYYLAVKSGDEWVPLELQAGHPYFEQDEGQEFEIYLVNEAPYPVACVLELDGVNAFALSTKRDPENQGQPAYTKWVVRANSVNRVPGWYRDNDISLGFKVTTDEDNFPAKELGIRGSVGTIRATFAATWPQSRGMPPSVELDLMSILDPELAAFYRRLERDIRSGRARPAGPTGPPAHIGAGRASRQTIVPVAETHTFGTPRAVVTLRYRLREAASPQAAVEPQAP